ncbi:MAG TPA: histidine phosphatase family protein [Gemmatimonadaceae bacterium]|jgi:probable phosphoglycerate mutase|nr:histidine phosphatase family protein [Gemmatimonadaceae bacterium]
MTTFLLIRHALCDPVGHYLAGRLPDISLNEAGRSQAAALASRLSTISLDAIYSSPMERARETADAIAVGRSTPVELTDELIELDFAEWTGHTFPALDADERWRRFNNFRSMGRAASGELMLSVQARAVALVERLRAERPKGRVALVSHGDVIKGLVAHVAGIPLDLFLRIDVHPASVSIVEVTEHSLAVRCLNVVEPLPL